MKTRDAATVAEIAFLEGSNKEFIVELTLSRNTSYVDCITPCSERKPFSDEETFNQILSTFRFTPTP